LRIHAFEFDFDCPCAYSQAMNRALRDALNLSLNERIQLVQGLWDSISSETRGNVARADILEAEKRLNEYEEDPSTAISWELVAKKLG
jgi:putative addiction module component (TIGR02574 family)